MKLPGWTRVAAVAAALTAPAAHAETALPYPKRGQCAGDYYQSGGYCAPKTTRSQPAIPKQPGAQCPAGWRSGASSCTKERR